MDKRLTLPYGTRLNPVPGASSPGEFQSGEVDPWKLEPVRSGSGRI